MTKVEVIIPSGRWQRVCGILLFAFAIFATLAATPFNGAAGVAAACFALGGSLLFWGFMLFYFSILERKICIVIDRVNSRIEPSAERLS